MRRRGEEKQQQALGEGERFSSRWLEKEEAAAGAWRREKQQGGSEKASAEAKHAVWRWRRSSGSGEQQRR